MTYIGRWIVVIGLVVVVLGLLVWGLGKLGFRGLPGDFRHESENVRIFVPIVTMIVASIVLTILLNVIIWLWQYFNK